MFLTIVIFVVTLLVLVVIHELGHFFAAKKFGVKVLEFGFGIPPRIFGKKFGETLYSLNWLPFGGFVRLLGEDESDPSVLDNKRSFAAQAVWKRIIIVIAGVVMNLVLAWALFYITLSAQGFKAQLPLLAPHQFVGVQQTNERLILVGQIAPNSPASAAGLADGDRVLKFNGQNIRSGDELIEKTKQNAGHPIELTVSDAQKNNVREVKLTPRVSPPPGQGPLGVSLGSFEVANLNYATTSQKVFSGPVHAYNLMAYSVQILGDTFSRAFTTRNFSQVSQTVSGPIGITSLVGQILEIKNPVIPYLEFLAMLSLNLAIINILPFPGLDGGRLLFLVIEAVTRKKAHPVLEKYVHTIGLMILISLIVLVSISDIKKLF